MSASSSSIRADFASVQGIAGVTEEAFGVPCRDGAKRWSEFGIEGLGGARRLGPESGLQLGPARLDGVEVGRVARKVDEPEPRRLKHPAHRVRPRRSQVVHDHHGTRFGPLQLRHQDLLEVGQEHGRGGRRLDAHGGHHALGRGRPQDGEPVSGTERGGAEGAPALWRADTGAGHLGGDPALVDEDQPTGAELGCLLAAALALGRDLGPILLGRPERLFLRVSLRRLSAWHSTGWLTRTPVRSAKRAAYSASVTWLSSATSSRKPARAGAPSRGRTPPRWGLAARRPFTRAIRRQLDTVAEHTPKPRAIPAWLIPPPSQAASTRSRRSTE
jgi:hypothetical protein